jgi:hypothetical protein
MNQNLLIILLFCCLGQLKAQSPQLTDSTQLANVTPVLKQPDSTQLSVESAPMPHVDSSKLASEKRTQLADSLRLILAAQRFRIDSVDYKAHTGTHIEAQANYMSNIRYSGRDFGVKGYGLSTQLSFKHKSGFWLSAIGYHWQAFDIKVPKTDLIVGYAQSLGSRVGASVSYSRWLYFGRSQSELRWAFNHFMSLYTGINATYFTIAPQVYYMISPSSNVVQFAVSISKNKEWRPFLGGKLIFEPSLTWMTSTKDRYSSIEPTVKAGKIWRVIAYELTLPLIYRRVGKYEIAPRYVLSLPVNVSPYDGVEEGKLTSVFSLDVKYMLWQKR